MQKALYAFVSSQNTASNICALLISFSSTALFAENYLFSALKNTIFLLGFNLTLALVIILTCNSHQSPLYNSIVNDDKGEDYKTWRIEFLKLSGNFCLISVASLISAQYFTLKSNIYNVLFSSILCILIMLRWNSKLFLKKSATIFYSFFSFNFLEADTFIEIVAADVWTSLAKAPFLPNGIQSSWTKIGFFW